MNTYLEGAFAPIDREYTLTDLAVTGTIPDYLDGRYLRNGPNPVGEIDPELYHWFMGDGMVHGIRLRDGKAEWYRNRWVRSPAVSAALGEPAQRGTLMSFAANTNVVGHAGKTLALVEGGATIYELTDELDTVGVCDFDGTLSGGYTAHPKRDPKTGELHAVSYTFGKTKTVVYSVIGTDGRVRRTVDIPVTGSPMMHDFALTEHHVVFYDLPVTFDADQIVPVDVPAFLRAPARLVASAVLGRIRIPDPIAARLPRDPRDRRMPYRWHSRYPARVGVMPRDGDSADLRWFDIDPCYVFHSMNAYDDGDTIVIDVVRYPTMFDTELHGPNESRPTLDRWTVDLADGKVREERIDDRPQEFPRVDERVVGGRHRYGYAPSVDAVVGGTDSLLKHDFVRGSTETRSLGAGKRLGEFVFHPSAPDAAEDDGVLMGYVHDRATHRSELAILDARTLENVATVQLPHRIPAGFHGNWVPSES